MGRPNVLVVMSDQQRPDSCGVYGQRLPVTPALDGLAADGVVFDEAFTVQPVCGPSRAAFQTGRMPTAIGCWRNGLALPPGEPTLASRLHALGYQTGYVGKWHLASDRGPLLPDGRTAQRHETGAVPLERRGGYDAWAAADALELTSGAYGGRMFDEDGREIRLEGYRVDAVTDVALDRLARFDTTRPFLLFVSFLEPHHQNNRMRTIGPVGWADRFRHFDVPGDLAGWRGDWRWNYAEYLACCASIDANLGRLTDALRVQGRLDGTLVVYTSDHGSHFRTRNLEYKRSCHDASIRIPLVLSGPGFRGGRRRSALRTNLDLVPTLVAAAGGTDPDLDGRPLQNDHGDDRDEVLIQISESHIGRALRTRTHTIGVRATTRNPLAGHLRPSADTYRLTHLYDNEADPHQRTNRTGTTSNRALAEHLADRLRHRIGRVEARTPQVVSPA
ncbi:MAG: sulfatase-like hydrolase/transferase [Microthrixaceae bacterium]|nr:sulfatase-like hydrolase/transferase [Microthrixaceae bacterium]